MTEHPTLELLKKKKPPISSDTVARYAEKVREFVEDNKLAKEFAPVALVDSQRLENAVLGVAESAERTVRHLAEQQSTSQQMLLQEFRKLREQDNGKDPEINGKLDVIIRLLQKQDENVQLEREVLTKLSDKLGE